MIETYNLKFDYENLKIDEEDNTVDCNDIFDFGGDISRQSVQRDLKNVICTIEDLS